MAGNLAEQGRPTNPDILFDLTPEDDKQLRESDLLQLVNYGQLQKPIKVLGTGGKVYTIELALLWDEDHIEILRKTTSYAGDPLLRVQLMRRLKMHKAIQKIDDTDYSDKKDMLLQRRLWAVLSRVADRQMEQLDAMYKQLEIERDLMVLSAMKELYTKLDSTLPKDIRRKENGGEDVSSSDAAAHEQIFAAEQARRDALAGHVQELVTGEAIEGKPAPVEEKEKDSVTITSPKQSTEVSS